MIFADDSGKRSLLADQTFNAKILITQGNQLLDVKINPLSLRLNAIARCAAELDASVGKYKNSPKQSTSWINFSLMGDAGDKKTNGKKVLEKLEALNQVMQALADSGFMGVAEIEKEITQFKSQVTAVDESDEFRASQLQSIQAGLTATYPSLVAAEVEVRRVIGSLSQKALSATLLEYAAIVSKNDQKGSQDTFQKVPALLDNLFGNFDKCFPKADMKAQPK